MPNEKGEKTFAEGGKFVAPDYMKYVRDSGQTHGPGTGGNDPMYHSFNTPLEQFQKGPNGQRGLPIPGTQWGIPDYWKYKADQYLNDPSRQYMQSARAGQQAGLSSLYDYATGKKSFAREQFGKQRDRLSAQATSMAQSGVGGYNPAAARQGIKQAAGASSQLRPQLAMAEQAEQAAALQNYLSGAAQMRSGEADWWTNQAGWQQAKSDMSGRWHALGAADIESQRQAQIQRAKMLGQAWLQGRAIDATKTGQYMQLGGEGMQSLGQQMASG